MTELAKGQAETKILNSITDEKLAVKLVKDASYKIETMINPYTEKVKLSAKEKAGKEAIKCNSTTKLLKIANEQAYDTINLLLNDINMLGTTIAKKVLNENHKKDNENRLAVNNSEISQDCLLTNHVDFNNTVNNTSNIQDTVDRVNKLRVDDSQYLGKTIADIYDDLNKTNIPNKVINDEISKFAYDPHQSKYLNI